MAVARPAGVVAGVVGVVVEDLTNLTHGIVLDFESTCDDVAPPRPQEIIEFPSVLVRLEPFGVVDEFASFVRPHHHRTLTGFCRQLTSITQADIDDAPLFPEVFAAHGRWLTDHGLTPEDAVFVTCGDWDLGTMLPIQLAACVPPITEVPPLYMRWLNIKRAFAEVQGGRPGGMTMMLRLLDLPLVGTHHRGLDDCRNIARILEALLQRGLSVRPTN